MADRTISLNMIRAQQANDSSLWAPVELLEELVGAIKAGEIKPEQLVVHYTHKDDQGQQQHSWLVSNCTWEQHYLLLQIAGKRIMDFLAGVVCCG